MTQKHFRQCVVALFTNTDNMVLTGQRSDNQAWQLPQGGVDKNEDELTALYREMKEEIGCDDFMVLKRMNQKLRYIFPNTLTSDISRAYAGQEQRWFLCKFNADQKPNLKLASCDEFQDLKWTKASEVLHNIVSWKREVYEKAFTFFNLL